MSDRDTKRQEYRNLIGSVGVHDPDEWTSDNLAIVLCTYFSDLPECPSNDEDSEKGWSKWAMRKTDEVLDVVVDEIIMPTHDRLEELQAENTRLKRRWDIFCRESNELEAYLKAEIEKQDIELTNLKLAAQQPTARRTDIETSHEAAQDAAFNATMNQLNVLLILNANGPLTDFELADHSGVNQNSIGKRRLDCQRAGLVEAHIIDGEKIRRKSRAGSKSKAQVWKLTKAGTAYIKAWKQEQNG